MENGRKERTIKDYSIKVEVILEKMLTNCFPHFWRIVRERHMGPGLTSSH